MWNDPEFIAALTTTLTAACGGVAFLLDHAAGRRAVRERQAHVASDQAVAEFWNAWLTLQAAVRTAADYELAKAQARAATAALPTYPQRDEALAPRSALSAALLLYLPPRRTLKAWAARILFYAAALFTAAYVAAAVTTGFAGDDDPEGWAVVGLSIVVAIALGGVAYLLRLLSLRLETWT
jgi:hypothetical protein